MNQEYKRFQELAGLINENEENNNISPADNVVIGVFDSIYNINQLKSFLRERGSRHVLENIFRKYIGNEDLSKYSNEGLKNSIIDYWLQNDKINETTIISKNTDSSQIPAIAAREKTDNNTVQQAINQAKQSGKPININETSNNKMKKSQFKQFLKEEIKSTLSPKQPVNEMAAIKGDIKTKVDQIIADNPDMEVGPLARMIMKDPEINSIIDRDNLSDMAQNQTQKYIRLARGERELQQRGRKADPNKPASTPKSPKPQSGFSTEDMVKDLEAYSGEEMDTEDRKWKGKFHLLNNKTIKSIWDKYLGKDVPTPTEKDIFNPSGLNEMAKLTGSLADAIGVVIANVGDDLDGLALKKAIKADPDVIAALGSDTLYDNQLNKFIALAKGERELGQRGRKADPNKTVSPNATQKAMDKATGKDDLDKAKKPSLKDLVDDEDIDIEDTWSKPETDFDDDFQDDDSNFSGEDTSSLDKERSSVLKDQETKKFWKSFVSKMKEKGEIDASGKPKDKERYEKARAEAKKILDKKLKGLK